MRALRALGTLAVWLFSAFVLTAIAADALLDNLALTRSWWGLLAAAVILLVVVAAVNESSGMTLATRFRSWREMRRYR